MSNAKELAFLFTKALPHWPSGRLPTVRSLAQQHEASTRTVQEALELLRSRGLVESRPRSGLWRLGELPQASNAPVHSSADVLLTRLRNEIQNGIHPWDHPLPLIKELATQWNCHTQTVSKALCKAIQAGLLERRGRFHFPVNPKVLRKLSSPTILCIGAAAADGHFRMDSDRESDFWRELGAQAAQAGLTLVRSVWQGGRIRPEASVVGVVASTWHYADPMAVCRELSRLKIPVCVWVEEHILEGLSLDSPIRFHDQGYSSEIGSIVARHLLELGHKHLAFISPWQASQWSRNRLRGIEKEVKKQGGQVSAFCLEGESEWDRLIPAMTDPVLLKKFPTKTLAKIVEDSSERVHDFVVAELGWNRIRQDMIPLLEQALASGATAWIGANDLCALNAIHWLDEKNIPVPKRISVAGFDDIVEALRADLTSFRFSSASMARSMITQILSSSAASTLTRHEGMVVARRTTAKKQP